MADDKNKENQDEKKRGDEILGSEENADESLLNDNDSSEIISQEPTLESESESEEHLFTEDEGEPFITENHEEDVEISEDVFDGEPSLEENDDADTYEEIEDFNVSDEETSEDDLPLEELLSIDTSKTEDIDYDEEHEKENEYFETKKKERESVITKDDNILDDDLEGLRNTEENNSKKNTSFKPLAYILAGVIGLSAIGGGGYFYLKNEEAKRVQANNAIILNSAREQTSSIYLSTEMPDANKNIEAVFVLASMLETNEVNIVNIALTVSRENNATEEEAKTFARLVLSVRKELISGQTIDELRAGKILSTSVEKSESINLDEDNKANFIIRSLITNNNVNADEAVNIITGSENLKIITDLEKAEQVADLSSLANTVQKVTSYQKAATELFVSGAYEEALDKLGNSELASRQAVQRANAFIEKNNFYNDVKSEIVETLSSKGLSSDVIERQITSNEIIERASENGFTGDRLLEEVNREILDYARNQSLTNSGASQILSETLKSIALREGYQEDEAIIFSLVQTKKYLKEEGADEQSTQAIMSDASDSLLSTSLINESKKKAVKNIMMNNVSASSKDDISSLNSIIFNAANIVSLDPSIESDVEKYISYTLKYDPIGDIETTKIISDGLKSVINSNKENLQPEQSVKQYMEALSFDNRRREFKPDQITLSTIKDASTYFAGENTNSSIVTARVGATYLAQKSNLDDLQVGMASVIAESKERAKIAGLTAAEQDAVATRAGEKIARNAGLSKEDARFSVDQVKSSLNRARTAEELAGLQARREASENNSSLLEQNYQDELAKLRFRAEKNNSSVDVIMIAEKILQAQNKSYVLTLSAINTKTALLSAEKDAYSSIGLDVEQYQIIMKDVHDLLSTQTLAAMTGQSSLNDNRVSVYQPTITMGDIEKKFIKLDLSIAQIENQMETFTNISDSLKILSEKIGEIEISQIKEENKEAVKTVSIEFSKEFKAALKDIKTVKSNIGWLSARACRTEAINGVFPETKACGNIYKRSNKDYKIVKEAEANKGKSNQKGMETLPKTTTKIEQEKSRASYLPKTSAVIPRTAINKKSAGFKAIKLDSACINASKEWVYKGIWDNGASLSRYDGLSIAVGHGSSVQNLGKVLYFQLKKTPKFIRFENGIVCRD